MPCLVPDPSSQLHLPPTDLGFSSLGHNNEQVSSCCLNPSSIKDTTPLLSCSLDRAEGRSVKSPDLLRWDVAVGEFSLHVSLPSE